MIGRRGLVIVVLASLITGGAIGLVGGILFAKSVFTLGASIAGPRRGPLAEALRGGPRPLPLMMLERRLGLTREQTEMVRAEVERSRAELEARRESLVVRIERDLTAEQRERWRELRERFPEPGRPSGPPPRPNPAAPGPEGE